MWTVKHDFSRDNGTAHDGRQKSKQIFNEEKRMKKQQLKHSSNIILYMSPKQGASLLVYKEKFLGAWLSKTHTRLTDTLKFERKKLKKRSKTLSIVCCLLKERTGSLNTLPSFFSLTTTTTTRFRFLSRSTHRPFLHCPLYTTRFFSWHYIGQFLRRNQKKN